MSYHEMFPKKEAGIVALFSLKPGCASKKKQRRKLVVPGSGLSLTLSGDQRVFLYWRTASLWRMFEREMLVRHAGLVTRATDRLSLPFPARLSS